MDIFNIASALFGSSRIEDSGGLSNTVDSVSAVGATASVDGSVGITMDADVTPADDIDGEDTDQTIIDVPTSPAVDVEDDLILGLTGDGPLKVPVVLANPGSGDRMQAAVMEAHDLAASVESIAQEAKEVAEATGQNFWPDSDGVHVTEVTRDEWNDSTSPNYHSGANVLLNALGQLFRDGLNNLLALLPSAGETYTETFTLVQGEGAGFVTLQRTPDVVSAVTVDGVEKTDYRLWGNEINFDTSVSGPATIEVSYRIGGSSIALFDGLGNAAENVLASFGVAGATIGYERGGHVKVNSSSLSVMNGDTHIADFGEITKFYAGGGEVMRIVPGEIDFSASDDASFIRFNDICSINSDVVTVGGSDLGSMNIYADELTMEAKLKFPDSTALPNSGTSTDFLVVGITSFANGGILKYKSLADMQSWLGGGVTTATLTRGTAASSWNTGEVRKYGHVVSVCINDLALTSQLAAGATSGTITTIPAGYRPPRTARFNVPIAYKGTWSNVWMAIGTGGNVVIVNDSDYAIPAGRLFSFTHTYIVT